MGSASPSASVRQFMELAVNMPEHEPQVGQARRSMALMVSSATVGSAASIMASMRSSLRVAPSAVTSLPDSMGPPEMKIVGMFRRREAMSMPGVILSQLEMHTRASAQWAETMYSTESAMRSRLGRE